MSAMTTRKMLKPAHTNIFGHSIRFCFFCVDSSGSVFSIAKSRIAAHLFFHPFEIGIFFRIFSIHEYSGIGKRRAFLSLDVVDDNDDPDDERERWNDGG